MVLVATLLAAIQSAIIVYGVSRGLGRSTELVSSNDLVALQKAAYVGDILYLLTDYLSKCSVILLLLRLSQDRKHRFAFNATLIWTIVVSVASVFAVSLRCDLSNPWLLFHEKCSGLLLRWQFITAFDILTELIIFGVSFYLIHGLHMSLSNKFIIVGVFAFRLLMIPFLVVRLISFPHHHLPTDPAFTMTYFYIWTQTSLYLSLMLSTMPCLKPFVASLNTGYGAFDTEHVASRVYADTYGSSGIHNSGTHPQHRRRQNSRSTWGSKIASGKSKPTSNVDNRPNSIVGKAAGHPARPQGPAVDDGPEIGHATTSPHGHRRQRSQLDVALGLAPRVDAGQDGRRVGEGRPTPTHTSSAVAQDGNSIGSDDSRQMIIRKDVTWAVEYSDPRS
ncbi:MAG: hypothetical protein LQ339_003119 [Xanthoria mediterranea]|nr:MAG: hypothetical protein LQ339_003119 [Xanthoria mediterranea]